MQVVDWIRKILDRELERELLGLEAKACYDEMRNEETESVHNEVQVAHPG